MSKSGINNFKGLHYQTWAAVLLFLMRSRDGSFDSIIIEDENWEDFTLVNSNGKSVVCEVKNYKRALTASDLLKILNNILGSPEKLRDEDEILIICKSVSKDLENRIKYIHWSEEKDGWFTKKQFSQEAIDLLPKVSFFEAESEEFLYAESLAYFYNYPKLENAWLPQADVERWLDSIAMKGFFKSATKGERYSRKQLLDDIDKYYEEQLDKNVDFDKKQTELRKQYSSIFQYIRDKDLKAVKKHITAWTIQPELIFVVIDEIFKQKALVLSEWDDIWSKVIDRQYSFRVIHGFKQHNTSKQNVEYVIKLFTDHINAFTNPAFDDFRAEYAMMDLESPLKQWPDLASNVYDFIETFLKEKRIDYNELDNSGDRQEKVEVAKLLELTFDHFIENNNTEYVKKVLNLCSEHFNLVDDDGEFDIYTPGHIFNILRKYLESDFSRHLEEFIKTIVNQYQSGHMYNGSYDGWDGMGGSISQSGNAFKQHDRHYLVYSLQPALLKYYEEDKERGWKLITARFVAATPKDVSAQKPDFLGRASISVLLDQFVNGPHEDEAFGLLSKQILMKKGIPSKHDLIYQEVYHDENMPNDKKWQLIAVFLDAYKLPYSIFIEQTVSDMAIAGDSRALAAVKEWMQNPDYRKRQHWHSFYVGQSMFKLLATDPSSDSFATGVEILRYYLTTKEFTDELDTFDSYDISRTIAKVIENDYAKGLEILQDINAHAQLTKNQQVAIWHSIEQVNKEDGKLLKKIYDDFVEPVLINHLESDNTKIENRFSFTYARELIVQYAEHLAKTGHVDEALVLARIFINDSDPSLKNRPDDPEGKFNYHERILAEEDQITINTVRGWVAWVLAALATLRGKDHLDEITGMVDQLLKDKNLYVVTMATIPLTGLVQNRHTVLPNTDVRFISRELSDRIEKMVLDAVDRHDNKVILHHLEAAVHRFRTMTTEQAMHVFEQYGLTDLKGKTDDIYTLLVSFALFRKQFFIDKSFEKLFGKKMYEVVNDFDDRPFKDLLERIIDEGDDEARTQVAWFFWTLPKKGSSHEQDVDLSFEYLDKIADKYSREAYGRISYFIKDRLDERPEQSLELWEKITKKERDWLLENSKTMQPHEWWSHHNHPDFLSKMRELKGDDRYMDMVEVLLGYPEGFQAMIGPDSIYASLVEINTERSKKVVEKLKSTYPQLYAKEA